MDLQYVFKEYEACAEKYTLPTVKRDTVSVMLLGCFTSFGTKSLQCVEGKMD